MKKIVELLTGKKEEEIRKGYEDIIKSKDDKIKNILQAMRHEGIITTDSPNRRLTYWILVEKN